MIGKFLIINLLIIFISLTTGIYIIKNNQNINIENIKDSIVLIIPESKPESYKKNPKGLFGEYKESGIGAGFFIDKNGTIQTVNHLVENDKISYKIIYKNKEYNSQIISRDSENDLAKLKITTKNKIIITKNLKIMENNLEKGNKIYSFGIDTQKMEITYNTGILLNKNSKLNNMSNLLEISNQLKYGFSGGPIIDSKGNVIGINYAVSEGKNYGINF